jgi:carbon-monoxide dehydrogenase medium subunit
MYDFAYQKPSSLADAVKALGADPEAKALAGGMTLIPVLKQRLNKPTVVVDLAKLGLIGISVSGNGVTISGMTTHAAVASDAALKAKIPSLTELAGHIGDDAVRHRGTIGGSLANNDPAADYPAAVLAMNAIVVTNRREIPADDFFVSMFETKLAPGEIVTGLRFPRILRAAYCKFPNPASRYAVVGVMIAEGTTGIRVAVTGAAACVFRVPEMEVALSRNFSPDALSGIAIETDRLNSDLHADQEYRAHLIGVMARRAVAIAGD